MNHTEHRTTAPKSTRCYVVTVSDTRTDDNDHGGAAVVELLKQQGHEITGKIIIPDDPAKIRTILLEQISSSEVDAIITTGGTGISKRDGTYEVVSLLLDKQIDGFGEFFRSLSFEEIGPSAMLSRACAGISRGKIIISVPGSEHAVRLAMTRLVLPELGHLVREARR